ncbi:hypothetical protein [Sporosarcina limicola]|uniref:Uncharacterized protein n=1 Tax=Sporosarcina limicola TaxID=34101 RepID=A0A927MTF8_9BACL|nr:hypothetical protein [Sporosarcina limicola]MBE1557036.1 hypothetical protein [Sporosarcina limicola]
MKILQEATAHSIELLTTQAQRELELDGAMLPSIINQLQGMRLLICSIRGMEKYYDEINELIKKLWDEIGK